jgi:catecholate siderophore receptor
MSTPTPNRSAPAAPPASPNPVLIPLGAMLLAGSMGAMAQSQSMPSEGALTAVEVRAPAEPEELSAKNTLRATASGIGKGKQALRDIPQSVTVMTEMLINDRNLDDFREVLKTTAGVTFQAGETGEEDVRLRGFSLGQAGDIYLDGLRDAPLIERDTFNHDRIEVLKGSASMLFGKGSTGGVVNQVNKQPYLLDQHEVNLTIGSGNEKRLTGDFNILTGDGAALRINAMALDANNHGASMSKKGVAPTYRWGIGLQDEFSVGFYHLETNGTPLYNHPWLLTDGVISPALPANNYYGLSTDFLKTESTYGTFQHIHRFDRENELKTTIRHGSYERELLASAVRFESGTAAENLNADTSITRNAKGRVGYSDLTQIQSDFSGKFSALGKQHELLAGIDLSREDADRNQRYTGETRAELPSTTVGTPNDGAVSPVPYGTPPLNTFKTQNVGVYVQDTLHLNPQLRLIAGLRFDRFEASYRDVDSNALDIAESLVSPRVGAIYQPSETASYYASIGTSYNTSGDTYQFALGSFDPGSNNAKLANTPPEKSRNIEIGGKFELFDNRATFGAAVFHTEKYNERNTDADSAAAQYLLSGKRHARGMEFNLSGRITPVWDIFYNHTWIPSAAIDESNVTSGNAQRLGDRPGLTPKHSASLWTTYRVAPMWRIGFGLNHRGSQNPEGNRNVTAPAFTTVDAMVEYMVSESATLKLNVTNLSNKLYADALYRGFYGPGAARTVQLSLKSTF